MKSPLPHRASPFPGAAIFLLAASAQALALSTAAFFPAANSTGICPDTPLKITFDAAPVIGSVGVVRIYHADGALVDALDLAQNSADGTQPRTIGGDTCNAYPMLVMENTATIFPHAGVLALGETYYVTVDAGVFAGFAGVSGPKAWRFTTKPANPAGGGHRFTIAADGSGDFCTVQGAVDSVPAGNTEPVLFDLRSGTYQEIVRVNARHHLAFRGEDRRRTIIAYPNNNNLNAGTAVRAMFNVLANDISLDTLTLANTTPAGGSQAEALRVKAQRCVVNGCDLRSYQDTFLVNDPEDTAYVRDSFIEGDVDFIWGYGRVVFDRCEIKSLRHGYLCQMRNPPGQAGAVFLDCRLTREPGATKVYLGRIDPAIYPASATAFVNCAMDAHILPVAWRLDNHATSAPDVRYSEYESTDLAGTMLDVSARAAFSKQCTPEEAKALRDLATVFGGWTPTLMPAKD